MAGATHSEVPGRLVVRLTFLEVVDEGDEQPALSRRCVTDSVLCKPGWAAGCQEYRLGSRSPSPSTATPETTDAEDHGDGTRASPGPRAGEERAPPMARAPAAPRMAPEHDSRRTTLMLRNIPNDYTRDMLLQMLDDEGFAGGYDFVYLPMDFERACGLGYAFVNLVDVALVPRFRAAFSGYTSWRLRTSKVCQVTWSSRDQGLKANVKRYRSSPVMHPSVPDEYKPCLFANGVRTAFPAPKGQLRRPSKKTPQ